MGEEIFLPKVLDKAKRDLGYSPLSFIAQRGFEKEAKQTYLFSLTIQ